MIEIIAVIMMAMKIKNIAKEKGLKPGKYIVFLLLLWFGLEFAGALIGMLIFEEMAAAYIIGLGLAIVGAFIAFNIVKKASPEYLADSEILDADWKD